MADVCCVDYRPRKRDIPSLEKTTERGQQDMIDVQCTINTTSGVEFCTLLVTDPTLNIKDLRLMAWVPRGVSWDQELDKLIKGVMAITGVDDPSQIIINDQPADLFSVV